MSKIFRAAAPIALSLAAPGLGTAIGTALGAGAVAAPIVGGAALGGLTGLATGGGLSGALTGAATGGLSSGLGTQIASGLGATGATATGLGQAIAGGFGTAAAGGDLGESLLGAGLAGGIGYVGGGGEVPGLGSLPQAQSSGVGPVTQGTGLLGQAGQALGISATGPTGIGSLTGLSAGGGNPVRLGSLLSAGGDIAGYLMGSGDLDEIQRQLAAQSAQAQAQYQPYAQAGTQALQNLQAPNLEALQADPGYQFQLQQGNQALERSLAARGLGQSGAALKAAQEYGQGLANQTYNDYFARQAQLAGQGFKSAAGLSNVYGGLGSALTQIQLEQANQRSKLFSGLGSLFG